MRFVDRYPIVVTPMKNESRDFWSKHLGFTVGFDSNWFCWLTADDGSASIAFMTPDHPSAPPGPDAYNGKGICFELEVSDVDAVHTALAETGLKIAHPLTDEPFGQRRFGFIDPSGLFVDVFQPIEPVNGYWDKYMV